MRPEEIDLSLKQRFAIWKDTWLVVVLCHVSWFVILLTGRGNEWMGMAVGVLAMIASLNADKVSLAMAVAMLWVFKLMQAGDWSQTEAGPQKFGWMVGAVIAGAAVVGLVGWLVSWWRKRSVPKDW